jgi:cytochrome c-type biogenesis protein CcmH
MITDFWIFATLLTAFVIACLAAPFLRKRTIAGTAGIDLAVLRDQRREIETDVANGQIDAGAARQAVSELEAEALAQAARPETPAAVPAKRWPWITALAVLVPAGALVVYLQVGSLGALSPMPAQEAGGGAPHAVDETAVRDQLARLSERLKTKPDDLDGWALLARTHAAMREFDKSATAYERAATLAPNNAQLLADWADALAMSQGRNLAGKPTQLIQRALEIDPAHRKALALAATSATDRGDRKAAVDYWTRLAATLPPDSPDRRAVAAIIAEIDPAAAAAARPAAPDPASAPAASAPAPAQEATRSASGAAGAVRGRVTIAPAIASKAAINDTLFIIARANDGSPMPVAVIRGAARELPREFVLDDSQAMSPERTISRAKELVIEARVSKSGGAKPQAGDLRGISATVRPGATGLEIVIDQVVP